MKTAAGLLLAAVAFAAQTLTVGLTQSGRVIHAEYVRSAVRNAAKVLVLSGLDGNENSDVQLEVARFRSLPPARRQFELLAVSAANPEAVKLQFPPEGPAYKMHPESHALWRWIGLQAPDLVVIIGPDSDGLATALASGAVAGTGRIPARHSESMTGALSGIGDIPSSEAAGIMRARLARSPSDVARQLEPVYGHTLDEPVYIPAMALMARMRLGHTRDVERIAAPYVNGTRDSLAKPTASHLSGHLLFAELAEQTGDKRYLKLVRRVADLGFQDAREGGRMKEAMPFHNEMSDSVFMGCPILAKAGKLTRERRYFDMALRHFRFMQGLCLRRDGLYRHSPLSEAAWGRGNAFPALGLALTLTDFPQDHPGRPELLAAYRNLMTALARHQDEKGMWRQVADLDGAYPELSATAMIGRAMLMGVRNGWIEPSVWRPKVDAAWKAVLARTASDGTLVNVCESTGKQTSPEAYLKRTAILDRDPRGGAMVLLFATEMIGAQRLRQKD